jgi:PKD repeat protein
MKALVRSLVVGVLAMAMVGTGLSRARADVNTPPEWVSLSADPSPANEGQTVNLHGVFTDPDLGDFHYVTVVWGSGVSTTTDGLPLGDREFVVSATYRDDRPSGTPSDVLTLTVSLSDGFNADVVTTLQLTLNNVAPTVAFTTSASSIVDHESIDVSGSFTDPSPRDTFDASLDWGDGSAPWTKAYLATDARTFAASHTYVTPGTYTVTMTVTDDDTGVGTHSATVLVRARNTAPTNLALSADSVVEGDLTTLHGTFVDPDIADTHSASVDWGDGTTATVFVAAGAGAFDATHVYTTAGTYLVNVTVTDPASASVASSMNLVVLARNHAPADVVLSVTTTTEGETATLTGSFSDPDASDAHTAAVTWGDGATALLSVDPGVVSLTATHVYATAGTYTVEVTVSDGALSANGSVTATVNAKPTPTDPLADMVALIKSWKLDAGTENSLVTKVKDSCSALNALANGVSAQAGKKLNAEQIAAFNAQAAKLSEWLGCASVPNVTIKGDATATVTPTPRPRPTKR